MTAFKHFLLNEWYFSLPMLFMGFLATVLVVWRFLLYMNARTNMNQFLPQFQRRLEEDGVQETMLWCRVQPGIIPSKLFVAGMEASPQGLAAMKRSMASAMELDIIPQLNFLLAPILAIAKIATMVGLLGTVVSMIGTFNAISDSTKAGGNPNGVAAQAQSIGLALFATALGLMTAIPLVFSHVLFRDWVGRLETQMKASALRLILLFQSIRPRQGEIPLEELQPVESRSAESEREASRDQARRRRRDNA